MEGITLSIIFSIIVSFMTGQLFVIDPQYTTQTDFVNYQVTLLPQNIQLVGRENLQLTYKAYVSEYYYFTDNSISDDLLKFYSVYAYALYGKRVKSVDDLMRIVSSANYPVYPVKTIVLENNLGIKQEVNLVKLFYVLINNNKYLIIPYTSEKYIFLPIVEGNSLFKVSIVGDNGIQEVNSTSVISDIQILLSDAGIEQGLSELDVTVSGSYTKDGITSIDLSNPNDYYVIITLFNYEGDLEQYFTVYVPPNSEKHLNLNFIPTHAIVWKGFRPRPVKLSLSYVPTKYMLPDKSEYYEGETIKIMLTMGTVGDYEIHAELLSNNKEIQVYYQSTMSKYFQLQAPDVDAFTDDVLKITLTDKETGLIIESVYLTIRSRIYVKSVFADLEEGKVVITLSKPLIGKKGYTVDVITKLCPLIGEECGVRKKELSVFDLESQTITAELDVDNIQIGYNKITVTIELSDPTGKSVKYSKTIYRYISPDLFINDIKLDYDYMSGNDEYLYKGGEVKLKINVNNNIVSDKKKIFVTVYVNNKEYFSGDISDDYETTIPIRHKDNYLLVTVYVNNIQVYSSFYLTEPKPIHILILQNIWILVLAISIVGFISYRQKQKHPEMRLMKKYDIRKARKQIEEYLRMKVIERIGTDAVNVLFVYDVANNNYITAWISSFTRKAYLLVTDMMLNTILETELPPEELFKMMQKINQGENPYEVAVDTYNTVKAHEISELARDVYEDMMQPKLSDSPISGFEDLDIGGKSIPTPMSEEPEQGKNNGFLDKLDNLFSDKITGSESELIETSGSELNLEEFEKESNSKNKKRSGELDIDLDLGLDFDLNF